MGGQQIVINRQKQNFRKKKRIVKRAHRNQPKGSSPAAQPIKELSEKKQRREAKKKQAKLLKKQIKQEKKLAMDAE